VRVLYDLRYASAHFTGIGTHAWQLLRALLATREPDETFVTLWNPSESATRFDPAALRITPGIEWRETAAAPLGLSAALKTGAIARAVRPDAYLSPFYLWPWAAGCPSILTLHDAMHLAPEVRAPWSVREKFRLALRSTAWAERVVTSSEFSRREILARTSIPADHLCVAPLGVPVVPTGHEPRRPAGSPEGPFALAVGVNRPHKNLDLLARVWCTGEPPRIPLVVAGQTDARFTSLAPRPGVVHLLGQVADEELDWLYRNAALLVFPTLYEGFGLPLLEAASRGLPVLASDLPVLRECGEEFARFLPPRDEAAWRSAVNALAADAPARSRMALAGRAAAARWDYTRCAVAVRGVLREVVGRAA
jgi:glycosyltransferase involved in cell wall biosynthesis